ncbi:MAG: hypothetical protein HZA51_09675 [Planctomycetes bacterium]|nr:hypothetical protein [Planctomycetota bacterium]
MTTTTGTQCRATKVMFDPAIPGGIRPLNCGCTVQGACGAVLVINSPTGTTISCDLNCPVPPVGSQCNVLVNGVPSGLIVVNPFTYPPGTTFECGCAAPPQCLPASTATGCTQTTCPTPGQVCLPRCIKVTANGQQIVVDCQCIPDTQCHIQPGPVPGTPLCVGTCPPGFVCERSVTFNPADGSTTYCCDCQPDTTHCQPTPGGTSCPPTACPTPSETCKPKCIEIDFQGQMHVVACECGNPDKCHAVITATGPGCTGICPPGQVCVQNIYPTPTGTAYCCECVDDPPFCEPTTDGQGCKPFNCPPDATGVPENCRPRCVRTVNGVSKVIDCDCRGQNECHVEAPAGTVPYCSGACPPGTYCVQNVIHNADGSVDTCCDCRPVVCDCPGDIDGNGILNGLDIAGFIRCLLGNPLPVDNCACVDMDGNGIYNNVDVLIFIDFLLTKHQCNPTPCCPKANLSLNIGTGVADDGSLLPINSLDTDWIVTVDASGGSVPTPATVVTPNPAWLTIPGTRWISANLNGQNGRYEYEYCFCLDDRFKNPQLSLQIRADDASTPPSQVFLNNNYLGNAASFGAAVPASLSTNNAGFFLKGRNCIKVVIENVGGPPTGFNMAGTVTSVDGKCCCPPADLSKNLNSGVYDVNGPFIPVGQDDDTWTVTCDATGGTVPRPARAIAPHPAWATIPGTKWISATTSAMNGLYCYQYCFCLDPRFKNATLTMDLLADDAATVWLNGVQIGATPNGWAFLNPPTHIFVTNQALFKDCQNCIEIRVVNSGGVITGMDVAATITAQDGLCCDDRQLSCCLGTVGCVDLAPGTNQCPGPGTLIPGPCENSQSCCLPNGSCVFISPKCCRVSGGTVLPAAIACSGTAQACCIPSGGVPCGVCVMVDPACCVATYGGVPQGPGSFCPPPPP